MRTRSRLTVGLVLATALGLLLMGRAASPQVLTNLPCPGLQFVGAPNGFETRTVSTTVIRPTVAGSLASPSYATAALAVMVTETAAIRYRDDGTAPTATVGMFVASASVRVICAGSLERLRLIRDTGAGADATVSFQYYAR